MSLPHLDLAANAHDRVGDRRVDETWLAERWADPASRALALVDARILPVDGRAHWLPTATTPPGERVLLGEHEGRTWFAVLVDQADAPGERDEWLDLRTFVLGLGERAASSLPDAPLVFHAVGLAEWHRATRFCPRCGGRLRSEAAGHELRCESCGRAQFPRTDPAVIMIVAHGEPGSAAERCLLGRHPAWPANRYSTLAGFVEPGETLEDACRREVAEETSVRVGAVEYFGNQPWPLPASLMFGLVARAETDEVVVDGQELEDARWFTRAELEREAGGGSVVLPGGVSISRSLVQHWYGGPLPHHW